MYVTTWCWTMALQRHKLRYGGCKLQKNWKLETTAEPVCTAHDCEVLFSCVAPGTHIAGSWVVGSINLGTQGRKSNVVLG